MIYGIYKLARNAAWQCLIDFRVTALPVKVTAIAKQAGITVQKDSVVHELKSYESGVTVIQGEQIYIIYRDSDTPNRCRFTIAHELGHIFLGHMIGNIREDEEKAANVFARDVLAPACVLHELNVLSPIGISNLCKMSLEAATIRAERITELENRNKWYLHPLERQVKAQFQNFIESIT